MVVVIPARLAVMRTPRSAQLTDAAVVVGRRAVGEAVDRDAAEVQVEVVLVGHADAAVQLHAVLQQLGAGTAPMYALAALTELAGVGVVRRAT